MNTYTYGGLKICFLLKVGDTFYSEQQIAEHLQELSRYSRDGFIDLYTTEGALSIIYNGEELLGVEFWDEINMVVGSIASRLDHLLDGRMVEEFLPLQTFWIRLIPEGSNMYYELTSATSLRPFHLKRRLPLIPTIHQMELVFWRMMRVMAFLGSVSSSNTLRSWQNHTNTVVLSDVDINEIKAIIEKPLTEVLLQNGCSS